MRKYVSIMLILAILVVAAGCAGTVQQVNVQRADQLALDGTNAQRYAAMVVNENVENVQRDSSKTILECYVTVGQEVKAGDKLFTYDSEALALELEKQQLELEKMHNEQITYAEQLEKLEKELENTWSESGKTQITLEINMLKTTQLENDYAIKSKESSIQDLQQTLENVDVLSPIDGTVRKIDQTEGAQSYITIQQHGAYRLKGSLNEMNLGSLMVGTPIRAVSRQDSSVFWLGTISQINTEDPTQDNVDMWSNNMVAETMMTSSGYVFYADLESTEGLLLGQHVYVEVYQGERTGLWIPDTFLTEFSFDEAAGSETAVVWVAGQAGLEKRSVSLGMYDGLTGCYEILSGLAAEDYVADPLDPGCKEGAQVSYRLSSDFTGQAEG